MTAPAPWLAAQVRELLERRGHAWLLHGPSGLGQYSLALELARAWLCEKPGPDGACGDCPSCHAVDVRSHHDLFVLMPETVMLELGWPLSEKAQGDIDSKKRKPSKEIRIDPMREAIDFAQLTSARGRGKVVLVYPAESMNHATANALLKTLEEPPGDVRLVLATESAHQLLPTIRSRCQGHALRWPAADEAQAWLAGQGVADPAGLLRAAGGRPEEALLMAQSGLDAKAWAQLPKALARGQAGVLAERPPSEVIDALQKVCHDLLAVGTGAAPRFFQPADLPRPAPPDVLAAWWRELAIAQKTSEHPFKADLMLDSLVARARSALNSSAS